MNPEIYFDNNATTRILPEVGEEILRVMYRDFGNASSAHRSGERVRKRLFAARESVSRLFGCLPENIVFGSGATELNNWILKSHTRFSGSHLITTRVEHPSVIRVAEEIMHKGGDVTWLDVDSNGLIHLDDLRDSIREQTTLVSIQWCNSETGVLQAVDDIGAICSDANVKLHCDAAQVIGKLAIDVAKEKVDFLTCSAHKIHGPQGVGAAYCRDLQGIKPMLVGGSQEFGLRAGTENIPGIVGFGVAARHQIENFSDIDHAVQSLRDDFESGILTAIQFASVNGSSASRNRSTSNIRFHGIDGQALVASLDQRGLRCSQSSACSNQIPEPSHVLRAMGLSEKDAYSSVRFSFSEMNFPEEIQKAVELVTKRVQEMAQNPSASFV